MSIEAKIEFKDDSTIENLKIIYLSYIRLTDRVASTWFIDDLLHTGIDVEYWDLIPFMRGYHREYNEISPTFLKELNSISELEEQIKKQVKKVVYVVLFPLDNSTKSVYIKLSKLNIKTIYIDWGAMPVYTSMTKRSKIDRIVGVFRSLDYFKLASHSKKILLLQKFNAIKKIDVAFASGQFLVEKPRHAAKVVSIPFTDYIEYKKVVGKSRVEASRFVVFLDINLPFQTDLVLVGMPQINPEMYYSELNSFFDMVENTFNVKVIIAAHPKTSLDSCNFGNRTVKRLKTAELVRDAEFVISHQSTSISYAVLNYKPIVFIYTQTMKAMYTDTVVNEIMNIAQYFGSDPININSELDLAGMVLPQIDREVYDRYIEEFIASKSSQHSIPSKVFISEILSLVNGVKAQK
jgi:hypothetical protein